MRSRAKHTCTVVKGQPQRPNRCEQGFALMTVLFVLLVMLVMAAPFLMTARNADKTASQMADRAEARVGLDTAARHSRPSPPWT